MDLEALKIDRPKTAAPSQRPTRRGGSRWPLRVGVLAALTAALWFGRGPLLRVVDGFTLPEVEVMQVRRATLLTASAARGPAANGYIVAARRAALSADTPGRIVELNVTEGSVVSKDDVVARLFSDEFAAAHERALAEESVAAANVDTATARKAAAEADLARLQEEEKAADANIEEALAAQKFAKEEFARAVELASTGISAGSRLDQARSDRDQANARVLNAKAQLAAAKARTAQAEVQVQVAEADVKLAQTRVKSAAAAAAQAKATLDKTEVRAPFDGVVVLKDAEVGEVVSPNSQGGSNARGSICTMVDRDSLEAQVDLPETSLKAAKIGNPVSIFLDAYPDTPYEGRVSRIWPTANRQKASVELRIEIFKKDDRLRPDMGVRIVLRDAGSAAPEPGEEREPQILVPQDALVDVDGSRGVFVLEQDTVRFQALQLGESSSGSRIPVVSGLREGQRIVVSPPTTLRSGDRVRIQGTS